MTKSNKETEDLEKAIEILKKEYNKAKNKSYINNPVIFAFYKTWTLLSINFSNTINIEKEIENYGDERSKIL